MVKMPRQVIVFLLFLLNIVSNASYNILGIFPMTGKSHILFFQPILKGLAEKGHNVTVLSHFPLKENLETYKDIVIGDSKFFLDQVSESPLYNLHQVDKTSRKTMYTTFLFLAWIGQSSCEILFESESVKDFIKAENKFDIVITEYFNSDCSLTISKKYDCPIMRLHSGPMMPWSDSRYGNPLNPAYMPNLFLRYSDKMSFLARVENTLLTLVQNVYFNWIVVRTNNDLVGRYFGKNAKTLPSDVTNDSLLLLNSHFTLNLRRPFVPNIIEVGGLHIGKETPLPLDLEKWINESEHGVIYFSMGSLVKSHTMPEDKRKSFINAFKRLPQRVIWKWDNDTMEGKTDNIMIGKWMPQFDILSHPKVRAFISHGGLLGIMESVHCGVPIMVMPQFGDQHTNAKAVESVGGGVILYLNEADEESIYQSLKKILEPSFQAQAKELSERFRDRPMPPLETAIYWVEYVVRHKGAHFMKTGAVNMPFYQYYLLDVIAFLLTVLLIVFYIFYLFLKFVMRKLGIISEKRVKQKMT